MTQTEFDRSIFSSERGFFSRQAAEKWEDALLIGNGVMGAMIYGRPLDEVVVLNRAGLFMPLEAPLPPPHTAAVLPEIRQLLAAGKYQAAADFVVDVSNAEGYGEKRWTDPFIPAADLLISIPHHGKIRDYHRGVDFATGVASVGWTDDRGAMLRRSFISRAANVFVMSLSGHDVDCQIRLATRPIEGQGGWRPAWFFENCIASAEATASPTWLTYRSQFKRAYPGSLQGYEVVVRIARNGDGTILLLGRVILLQDFGASQISGTQAELNAIPIDFEGLLHDHSKLHGELFNRARLQLGGGADRDLPSEELIAKSTVEQPLPALLEKQFDAARYLILSATGELPPVLPGIWVGNWGAPWSGDYTQNGNLQTALAGNLPTNMAELMLPYFDYLERQLDDYRTNAARLYGMRGIHVPSRTSSHGLNNHFDGTWPMTFWTAGAGWAAHFFYDYFLYTGDRTFLAERALPFMTEAAVFYEDFLIAGKAGSYFFSPSYSPENNPANEPSQACINATMDIAVANELLSNLISACELLGDSAAAARWLSLKEKLPAYQVNSDGALKEWATPQLQDNYKHRHASHLYPLYYGLPEEIEGNEALLKAFDIALEKRLEFRRQEPTGQMAFGLVQMGDCALSVRNVTAVFEIVGWLSNWYWSAALSTTHDKHNIFNVDICGGFPELITRMLVESTTIGRIELLCAVPPIWPTGKIEGVRCRGQLFVRSLEWTLRNVEVELVSQVEQTVVISVGRSEKSLQLGAGQPAKLQFSR